jgi:hypothetical protein
MVSFRTFTVSVRNILDSPSNVSQKTHTTDGICIPTADSSDNISGKQCGSNVKSEFDI